MLFSWPNTSSYQFPSRSRTFEITTEAEHCAKRAVTRSWLVFAFFCAKIPNSTHRRNPCQSPRRTRLKNRQSPKRCIVSMSSMQTVIRLCFTDSETRLDDNVRSMNFINPSSNICANGLMKSRRAFGIASELQRPIRPSKNSWSSPSPSKEWNIDKSTRESMLGCSFNAWCSAVSRILRVKKWAGRIAEPRLQRNFKSLRKRCPV